MNGMGLSQWMIIFQFAVYFCTYAVDLWCAVRFVEDAEHSS